MTPLETLKEDFEQILGSGINHTGRVMELLKERGHTLANIMPVIYQMLLHGRLDPKGNKEPYKAN